MTTVPRVPPDMFRFTHGDRSELYTAILQTFAEANERLETALVVDDIHGRIGVAGWMAGLSEDDFAGALHQLREWQLLDVTQNHSDDYRTAQEYERKNLQYSLTRRGEAAIAGVQHALATLAATGALQTAVLDAIAERLTDLVKLVADPSSDNRRLFSTLFELEGHLEALRNNTKQFNGELQRLLRAENVDITTFYEVKTATVSYLQEFLANLDQRAFAIANAIAGFDEDGADELRRRALLGADLPALPGPDFGVEWLAHRRTRWEGLLAWFAPTDGSPPRVDQLNMVARRAIVTLLQVLDRITESRRRASSAVADFRELARWFAHAPDEAALHRLWSTAFGLGSARHAHLAHQDAELVSADTTWSDSPAVQVSAHLRSGTRPEHFGRTARVRDVSAIRAARAARARKEQAEIRSAWDLLATDGEANLSSFGRLDHRIFERLLDMVGRALSAVPSSDGSRRAQSIDGRVEISLMAPADPAATALLHTERGLLRSPDFRVCIRNTARPGPWRAS